MHAMRHIIGIDEAGRGPLAGPIVVAGVRMSPRLATKILVGVRDSKQLSAKQREEWFLCLTKHPDIAWSVARISPAVIDRINIYQAAQLGAWRVYRKLQVPPPQPLLTKEGIEGRLEIVLLDGSLHLPKHILHETIIKGDELIPIIAAASIIAKVTRDRTMLRLHKKYPQYRFDLNKGYGTKLHREMIHKFGQCAIHRKSFRCS